MLGYILVTSAVPEVSQPPLWWTWIGGPALVGIALTGVFTVVKSVVDKKTKSPGDVQGQVQTLLDGLQGMITLMKDDKTRDTERIAKLQARIDELEEEADLAREYITKLYDELRELKEDVHRKDLHIRLLVAELKAFGVSVDGLDTGSDQILIFSRETKE